MYTRRRLLGALGSTVAVALAGCVGGGDDDGDGTPDDGGNQSEDNDDQSGDQNDDNRNEDGEWEYEGNPEDVPNETEARGIVDTYLLAISQGSPEAFTLLVHPDAPLAGEFSEEDIREAGEYLNYRYKNMRVTELDRENGRAVVEYDLAIITADAREQTESSKELRVHDGEWRVWLDAPLETGDENDDQ